MSSEKKNEKLPGGWVLCQSKSIPGRTYYFNKKTGKSSWSQPQIKEAKTCKKEKFKGHDNRTRGEKKGKDDLKKGAKRKSDHNEESTSHKRTKQESPDKKTFGFSRKEDKVQESRKKTTAIINTSCVMKQSLKVSPKKVTPNKVSPAKNLANKRLSLLRDQLASELLNETEKANEGHSNKSVSPTKAISETSYKNKLEHKSPTSDSKSSLSPGNESVQSMPSPSQFFAATKIISSMKAQLPDEYSNSIKQKDTFADIEKGICSQMPEYTLKHPATPPQFSEAKKLMSAIKSKLYKETEDLKVSSAKERMDKLRANLSTDLSDTELNVSNINIKAEANCAIGTDSTAEINSTVEAMDVEDIKEAKPNVEKDVVCEGDLAVVVDTNVFIHELDLVRDMLDSHIKGYREAPTLVVPWRVVNELDRMKDNNNGHGALCRRAKAAMDYLYKSLPENSRIVGGHSLFYC